MRMGELPRRWDADLTEALAALDPAAAPGLGGHELLLMPGDRYRWYSEDTYRMGEPAAIAAAADFADRGGHRWAARRRGTADWLRYVHAGYVLWRTFRLAEAQPFLEVIAAVEPERADTHFYLGQLCQDALGRMADAVACYQTFIGLDPPFPANNFLIDGWFSNEHAYVPSVVEALTNIGMIYAEYYGDTGRAEQAWRAAIAAAPDHHLAPHLRLADLLIDRDGDCRAAFDLAVRAERNYLATPWCALPYDRPCDYYPRLEAWAAERYPFAYRYRHVGLRRLAEYFDRLGRRCEAAGDDAAALMSYGQAHRLLRRFRLPLEGVALEGRARQAALALRRGDPWQAAALCREILRADPADRRALELLQAADARR